jgi:hypothetical protein
MRDEPMALDARTAEIARSYIYNRAIVVLDFDIVALIPARGVVLRGTLLEVYPMRR